MGSADIERFLKILMAECPIERIEALEKDAAIAALKKSLMNAEEAARYLGISKSMLYKLVRDNEITHYKPGGKLIFFLKWELREWATRYRIPAKWEADA